MESVLHQHEAALRAEKQAKQLKYKVLLAHASDWNDIFCCAPTLVCCLGYVCLQIRHWRATFLKPAQNAVKDCKFVMAQLGDIPGTAPVKRKMSRCAQVRCEVVVPRSAMLCCGMAQH